MDRCSWHCDIDQKHRLIFSDCHSPMNVFFADNKIRRSCRTDDDVCFSKTINQAFKWYSSSLNVFCKFGGILKSRFVTESGGFQIEDVGLHARSFFLHQQSAQFFHRACQKFYAPIQQQLNSPKPRWKRSRFQFALFWNHKSAFHYSI